LTLPFSAPVRTGIEDLYIERAVNAGLHNITFSAGIECWVRNVESYKPVKWNIRLEGCAGCEVRRCYVHDTWNGGGDSGYGVGLFGTTGECLVEDNIAWHCRHSFITEYGGQGNVFGYNYSKDPINENQLDTDYLMGDQITHGGEPRWNLWEGNVAATIKFDGVLGGGQYNTVFRCDIQRKGLPSTYVACMAADVQRWNYYANIVGCIYELPPSKSPTAAEYRWGSNQDDSSNPDPRSQATAYLDGIFSMQFGTTTWNASDADHRLPISYYLTAKPSWWDAGAWPAIGPDCSPMNGANPAMRRWTGVVPPSAATTSITVQQKGVG
jgi:hypothetical protein